ncbi:uncharacterized protein C19orf47 homolog [Bombina bombina]|uniref:uncharacterized protein C19orf47 homolog n=1 Tax=Bombina bombina TaxID=8345 RepID=UPI00235AD035|nr:uncharacterized protein C19orf47 homolog [Bombina bombina]
MASVTLATSEWIGFFKDAGIPAGPAVNYAVTFVDNRIQKNMLMDLNKEIMNELGITAVGDVIAILKHAKVVHRQDICKALIDPPSTTQNTLQAELRRSANSRNCTATRMIANSLSRDSPPSTPVRRPDTSASKISVTVSNKVALKNAQAASTTKPCNTSEVPVKRRRVTAEMEGKYVINMPKGTTAKTKKILEEQASRGFGRTSVFDRLGAENKADTTTGNKPTGVFSRLGDAHEDDKSTESDEEDYILPYEGVLKKRTSLQERPGLGVTVKAKATSSENKPAVTTLRRLTSKPSASAPAKLSTPKISIAQRLGKVIEPEDDRPRKVPSAALAKRLGKPQMAAQDSKVTSTKPPTGGFKVTIKRTLGSPKVSSSSDSTARMDNTRNVSVFKRLGRKSL